MSANTTLIVASLPAGMTECEGMCTMPMMAAESAYSSYTDFIGEQGIMDSDADYYPNEEAHETHFDKPIGQVRPCPPQFLLMHLPFSPAHCKSIGSF